MWLLGLLLALALAVTGCGAAQSSAGKFEGEQRAVADVVEELQTAAQTRKPEEICSDVLARSFAASLRAPRSDCVREVDKAIRDADDFDLEVTRVTITGNTAQAQVRARRGSRENAVTTLPLVREDGQWRLTGFGS